MAKNITIREGDTSKQFTAKKLKMNLVGGGTANFVPEDEAIDYVDLEDHTFNQNGTFNPSDFNCDGFRQVKVSVPQAETLIEKTINQNGVYDPSNDEADGYSLVTVNVSGGNGPVYSGIETPNNSLGENEDLYVRYEEVDLNFKYVIRQLYRKLNGVWVPYISPSLFELSNPIGILATEYNYDTQSNNYIWTAPTNYVVLAMCEQVAQEANRTANAYITTTGEILDESYTKTNFNSSTATRDTATRFCLIRLEIGDTITFSAENGTYRNTMFALWRADSVTGIDVVAYDAIVDNRRDNSIVSQVDLDGTYLLIAQQTTGYLNFPHQLSASITISSGDETDRLSFTDENYANSNVTTMVLVSGAYIASMSTGNFDNYVSKVYGVWRIS